MTEIPTQSTKEAVYKAWFPVTRRWLDFTDVSTTVHPDGTFRAHLCIRGLRVAGTDLDVFNGRWVIGRGLMVAATSLGRKPLLPGRRHTVGEAARR